MAEEKKDQNGQAQEPTAEENKRNWKTGLKNWGIRAFWMGIGAGLTIGITALRNRKKNRQQQ